MQDGYGLLRLQNPVMNYDWGSHTAIPELLGSPSPSPVPQAELWMGAHPRAPSLALTAHGPVPLPELIRRDPRGVLGAEAAARFGGRLPFLFKVLAAERALSIQVHPDRAQAEEGFARENERGLPPDDPRRCYRDPNPKPEVLCALSPFWALAGFRPPGQVRELLQAAGLAELLGPAAEGLRPLLERLLGLAEQQRAGLLQRAALWADSAAGRSAADPALGPVAQWLTRLQEQRPGDIGTLGPLLFNLLCLQPGEALFVDAGIPHAYLQGVGVELMANSDNVIRGGLTGKHVDVPELLRVLRFEPAAPALVPPRPSAPGERLYPAPAAEFLLAQLEPAEGRPFRSASERSVEILICQRGQAVAECAGCPPGGAELPLLRGQAVLVPAGAPAYELRGDATLFRASVP